MNRIIPLILAVALFMENMDSTVIATSLPAIAADIHTNPIALKLALTSYLVSLAIFIPVSGWMADRFGTRRVFAAAIALFTLGSLLCGLSTNIHMLVACRILQGMGGAMMTPVGRLVMVRTFERTDLVRAMSFVAVPVLIAPMLGPLVGGLIVDYLHWRVIFLVNIPVGIVGAILVWLKMPDYRGTPRPLDFLGLILFSSGVALLSYVLEVFGEHRLGIGGILGLLAISLLLILGYGLHAARTAFPLLNLTLFRLRTFTAAVGGSFITRLGVGGAPFLLPMLYQIGLGLTPVQSGLLIMPQALASMTTKPLLPRVLERFGYRNVLICNTLALGCMLMLFGTIGRHTPIWVIVIQALVYGVLTSLQFTSMNTLVYADVPRDQSSGASTIASTLQQLSVSFGVAVAGLTTIFFLPTETTAAPGLMIDGLHKAFFVLGGFTLVSTLIFSRLKRTDGGAESGDKDLHLDEAKG